MNGEPGRVPRVGDRLGKYVLAEKLGEGGMGIVYAGLHEGLGRDVAIKLLRAEYARNEQVMKRFLREAEAVSRIGHPNIVAIYDFGHTEDGSLYYVMERVRGETLRARLERRPALTDDELLALVEPMCRALGAAHALGIVHRDLKPENVLLEARADGPPHVKLLDFGVAKVLEVERSAALTNAGALIGTPTYMAPEQVAAAQHVDGRADLYALGAIVYVALTGRPPFEGDAMSVLLAHMRDAPPPPSTVGTIRATTPALEAMVLRALSKEPDGRPRDAAAFAAELRAALGRTETAAPAVTTTAAPAASGSRGRTIGIAAAAALLLGGGGLFLARRHGAPSPAAVTSGDRAGGPTGAAVAAAPGDPAARATTVVDAALAGTAERRRALFDALADVGNPQAAHLIVTGLDDDNPEVRRAAARAAAATGARHDATLLSALASAAQRSSGSVAVEIAAARLRLGDAGAVELLEHAAAGVERDKPSVLAAATLADAGRLSAAQLAAAIAAVPAGPLRPHRAALWATLRRLGDPATVAQLPRALDDADPATRLDAARALAPTGDAHAREVLAALAAAHGAEADPARAALAALGDDVAFAALAQSAATAATSDRAHTVRLLGALAQTPARAAAVRAALAPLVADSDADVRLAAAAALYAANGSPP